MEQISIFFIFTLAGYVLGQDPVIEASLSKSIAHLGDAVTFTCRVKYASNVVILGKMVNFFEGNKEAPSQYVEQITVGVDIYPKYTDEGRFDLTTTLEGEWTAYNLKISNVTTRDSATYACNLLNTDVFDSQLLEVYSLPKKMSLTNGKINESNLTLFINEITGSEMICKIQEVVPLPKINIKIDTEDYTSHFISKSITVQKPECYVSGYEGCLLHFSNEVTLTAPQFNPGYMADGKLLKCEAKLVGSGLKPVSVSKLIEMHYVPKFKCDRQQQAATHQKNAEIKCIVQANPKLQTVMFTFMWNAEMETLQPGSRTDDNEIHVTQTKINEKEVEVILIIKEVYTRHYLPYTLKASNQMGHNLTTIKLISAGDISGVSRIGEFSLFVHIILLSLCCLIS